MPITPSIEVEGNATLLLWGDGMTQYICLLEMLDAKDGSARAYPAIYAEYLGAD